MHLTDVCVWKGLVETDIEHILVWEYSIRNLQDLRSGVSHLLKSFVWNAVIAIYSLPTSVQKWSETMD